MDVNTQELVDKVEANGREPEEENNENQSIETQGSTQDELVDLDSLDRFKWDGREVTKDEFSKMGMRQSDYTRKTQELAEERKYAENFADDFETLANSKFDPQLVSKFKEIYPEKYHAKIDKFATASGTQEGDKDAQEQLKALLNKELEPHLKDLQSIKQEAFESKVAAESKWLDNQFDTMEKKYQFADGELVNSKLIGMLDQAKQSGQKIQVTEQMVEKLFKNEHDRMKTKVEAYQNTKAKEQSQANTEGFDTGKGGGPVGEGRKRMSLSEASQHAINTLTRG